MDILQNSIRAEATMISLVIEEDTNKNMLCMVISDNGKGMEPETLSNATDPFFTTRTTRKVGLGLSLLRQNAERTGGKFHLESSPGKGTTVTSQFVTDHPDMLPPGDLAGAFLLPVISNPSISFVYTHRKNSEQYTFSTDEVRSVLGGLSLDSPELYGPLHGMISENLKDINVS